MAAGHNRIFQILHQSNICVLHAKLFQF